MNKSRRFWSIIFILFAFIIANRFHQYEVQKDFLLFTTLPCSTENNCFILSCDVNTDPSCGETSPYMKIAIPARKAPNCIYEHECTNFECTEADGCMITLCDPSTIEDGETCINEPQNS